MINTNTIDLTTLSKEELIEHFVKYRSLNISHRLWCLTHPDIPINFSFEFVKLLEKVKKLNELNGEGLISPSIILDALIDSIYSDCRGLFCEREGNSKNYTLQNCLMIAHENEAIDKINEIINRKEFSDGVVCVYSFREWVKFVTDKAIVHKDNLTEDKRKTINYRYEFMNNSANVFEFQFCIYQIHEVYARVVERFGAEILRTYNKPKI